MIEYLTFKNGKFYIRNDYLAVKLFYKFFLFRPRIKNKFFKQLFFLIDCFIMVAIKLAFSLKLNYFLPTKKSSQNFLICRMGKGNYKNTIILYQDDKQLTIVKKFYNKASFDRELKFLKSYSNNTTNIKIPKYLINSKSKTIEYDFLLQPCLASEIRLGNINRKKALQIYVDIIENLNEMYEGDRPYMHGDLSPDNIYLIENTVYLIDFTDAEYLPIHYDFLFLLYRILQEYEEIDLNQFFEYLKSNHHLKSILTNVLGFEIDDKTKNEFITNYNRKFKVKHG